MKTSKHLLTVLFICLCILNNNYTYSQTPSAYDLRTYNLVTPVKDQGLTCGSCWAFATVAAIESQWLKLGYPIADLSEDNLIDCHGFDENPCDGGNFYMAQALLSMHKGILSESDDPYTPDDFTCPYMYTFPPTPLAYVEEIRFIPNDIESIKEAILEYGAVASTMFMNYNDNTVWDAVNYKYYDANISSSDSAYAHCITIVGWDNNMSFPSSQGNGGWIIKDSYGTSWADNGYFYCSFYDAGILSENAVYPIRQDIPPLENRSSVYAHDYLGWIDNYGFSSNQAYALTRFTIAPLNGNFSHQTIKRIGTYATSDNTTIQIELYREKNGNILSDLIAEASIECPYKGFYTANFNLNTDTIGTDIYIKVKYTSNSAYQLPIPIETYEEFHSSGFIASSNSAWISSDGNNWMLTGDGTSYNLDPCIKMFTENAPLSEMQDIPASICTHQNIDLMSLGIFPADSIRWLIDDMLISNMPATNHIFTTPGEYNIYLVSYLGNNTDTAVSPITVFESPDIPVIIQNGNSLESSEAYAYQWLDEFFNPIPEETNQIFTPPTEGTYFVQVYNEDNCHAYSEPFHFTPVNKVNLSNKLINIYPNPVYEKLYIKIDDYSSDKDIRIELYDIKGRNVISQIIESNTTSLEICNIPAGLYLLKIISSDKPNKDFKIIKF
jgi:C1A family cysteine protease